MDDATHAADQVLAENAVFRPLCPKIFSLKTLVVDDIYEALKKTFVRQGRGRPPDPPSVVLTNKLLLQLELLKQQSGRTNADVAAWFMQLFPKVSYPTSRLGGVLSRLLQKIQTLYQDCTKEECDKFLEHEVDLDYASASLMKFGLKRGELLCQNFEPQAKEPITHEVVVDLEKFRVKEGLKDNFTVRWVKGLTGCQESEQTVKNGIREVMQEYRNLAKKKGDVPDIMSAYLATPFELHSSAEPQPSPPPFSETNKLLLKAEKENLQLKELVAAQETEIAALKESVTELGKEIRTLLAATKRKDEVIVMNDILLQTVQKQKQVIRQLHPLQSQRLRERVKQLRTQVRTARRAETDLAVARRALIEEQQKTRQMRESFLRVARRQKQKLSEKNTEISALQEEIQRLHEDLSTANGQEIKTRVTNQGNRFSDNIRRTVLSLQADANVPASNCSRVIKIVAEDVFKHHFEDKDLPTTQTTLNITDEGQVLSNIQVAEKILGSDHATLHSDGTCRDHKKYVSQQVTLDSGETFSLGFQIVPTEDAATLLDLTVDQLSKLSDMYSQYRGEEKEEIFKKILQKITSLMSDRSAVMKKFNANFLDLIKSKIGQETCVHFLYCNAHYLLGLSRSCEVQLLEVEHQVVHKSGPPRKLGRDQSSKFGMFTNSSETATSRVIRTASDLVGPRGDEKNGCREDWLTCCQEKGCKSRMTSYRSNRFNSFFEGAAAIIHHHDDLRNFFATLDHSNLKTESVAADLNDPRLMALVCAVAVLYVRITGPYWALLLSHVKYSELYTYIQAMEEKMERKFSIRLLDPDFAGIFDGKSELQGDKAALKESVFSFASQHRQAVQKAVQQLLPDFRNVVHRQLGDFLEGGAYSGIEAAHELDHCPLTNFLGERIFGDLDYDMNKCRNASLHQRSSSNMLSRNKTPQWLKDQGAHGSDLLAFARSKGKTLRQQHRQQEQAVMLRRRQKLLENKAKKIAKQAKQTAAKAELVQRLTAVGGPCETAEDVNRLITRLEGESGTVILAALKDQIRFQKSVFKQKKHLRLMGTIEELTARLKAHLGGEDHNEDGEPVEKRPRLGVGSP